MQSTDGNINNNLPTEGLELSPVEALTKYAPLVKSRAMSFIGPDLELDDIIQEGNIGLLTAALKYDGSIASFATFARRCIDSSIIDYLRKSRKISQIPNDLLVDISDIEVADSAPDPEYSVSKKDEYDLFLKKAGSVLSKFEYSVFSYMLHGLSAGEISERLNLDLKSGRNAVQRIRLKLK